MTCQPLQLPRTSANETSLRYLARQPIFDVRQNVIGYELLFRGGPESLFSAVNSDRASLTTMDSSLLLGTSSLAGGKRAFINCTRELLVDGLVTLLPPDLTVLEILEDVEPDEELIRACQTLVAKGYTFALDDFAPGQLESPLLPLASIVKVDFCETSREEQTRLCAQLKRRGLTVLAEKVETQEDFSFAKGAGYTCFQGFFFCRPLMMAARDIPATHAHYLGLLQSVNTSALDIRGLEKIIRPDVSLCYRLLRYLNSAAFGLYPVRSIRHALILLGEREVRKWISLVTAAMISREKPTELIRLALVRAHFCESCAPPTNREDYFLAGLFSLLDAMLDRPMSDLLEQLPISNECRDALLGKDNGIARTLNMAIACERGDFDGSRLSPGCKPTESACRHYLQATLWSDSILSATL